jgi:hypothetical protein
MGRSAELSISNLDIVLIVPVKDIKTKKEELLKDDLFRNTFHFYHF